MDKNQSIFQSVFGEDWEKLPPVMHKRYANRPYSDDIVKTSGTMEVRFNKVIKLLMPFLRLTGALVPYQGKDVPTTVNFLSEAKSNDSN